MSTGIIDPPPCAPSTALFDALPFYVLVFDVASLLVPVVFATSGDSAQLVLGMTNMDGIHGRLDRVEITSGRLVSGTAVSLLLAGGIQAVQMATIVLELLFTRVTLLIIAALWRGVRADWAAYERHERVLRRRLEDLSVKSHGKPPEQP